MTLAEQKALLEKRRAARDKPAVVKEETPKESADNAVMDDLFAKLREGGPVGKRSERRARRAHGERTRELPSIKELQSGDMLSPSIKYSASNPADMARGLLASLKGDGVRCLLCIRISMDITDIPLQFEDLPGSPPPVPRERGERRRIIGPIEMANEERTSTPLPDEEEDEHDHSPSPAVELRDESKRTPQVRRIAIEDDRTPTVPDKIDLARKEDEGLALMAHQPEPVSRRDEDDYLSDLSEDEALAASLA